jgi:hypothetical protein
LRIAAHPWKVVFAARDRGAMTAKVSLATGVLAALAISGAAWARSQSYERVFTPFGLRHMTNDPDSDPELGAVVEKLDDPADEAAKVVELAQWVSQVCVGVRENPSIVQNYQKARLSDLDPEKRKDAAFKAHHLFEYMDYVEDAELCAGVEYMLGPKGALLPDAVTPGTGEMDLSPFLNANPRKRLHAGLGVAQLRP